MAHGQGGAEIAENRSPTLTCNHEAPIAAYTEPYTLAIRGRGDSHNLEYRQDGTANALLTPNGGRGGIGVGAVAVALPINTQIAMRHNALGESTGFGIGDETDPAFTLTKGHSHAVAVGTDVFNGDITGDVAATMGTRGSSQNASGPTVMQAMQVRRLTPVECERLQGFPDDYTAIPWRKKPASDCPDGPRYKSLGNSWAVPVVRWIGWRIQAALMKAANDNGQRGEVAA